MPEPKRPHDNAEIDEAGDDIPDVGGPAQATKPPSSPIVQSDQD